MIKKKAKPWFFGFMITVLSFVTISNLSFKEKTEFDCSTSLRSKSSHPDFTAKLNVFLHFQPDGTGFFDVTGKVDAPGSVYNVARTYHFNYSQRGGAVYHFTDISISSRSAENVSDNLMSNLFFGKEQSDGRYMRMTKMGNSYIIDNLYSPVFICINN